MHFSLVSCITQADRITIVNVASRDIFTFAYLINRESILFGSIFRNGDFDGLTRFEVSLIRKSHFLRLVCVYVCVYVCVCYQHNSKANYSRIFKFGILHLCHKYLKLFIKIGQKLWKHKKILIHYGLWTDFLVSEFSYILTAVSIMKFTYVFAMVKNM